MKIKMAEGVFAEVDCYADSSGDVELRAALTPQRTGGVLDVDKLSRRAREGLATHLEVEALGGCYDSPATGPALGRLAAKLRALR